MPPATRCDRPGEGDNVPTTSETPKGDHPVQAQIHLLDLEEAADSLLQKLRGTNRQSQNLAREAGVSVVMMAMEAADVVAEHSAAGPVTVQLIRGRARLTTAIDAVELHPGQMVLIQPGVRHDLSAIQRSVVVLTIASGRADT